LALNLSGLDLEQFKKFCSRRYVAARAVAAGFGLGQYVYIQATAPKARPHQPSALPDQRLHNFLKCSSRCASAFSYTFSRCPWPW
jgi:hypothetical protein